MLVRATTCTEVDGNWPSEGTNAFSNNRMLSVLMRHQPQQHCDVCGWLSMVRPVPVICGNRISFNFMHGQVHRCQALETFCKRCTCLPPPTQGLRHQAPCSFCTHGQCSFLRLTCYRQDVEAGEPSPLMTPVCNSGSPNSPHSLIDLHAGGFDLHVQPRNHLCS